MVEPSRKTSRFDLRYRDAFLKAFIDSYAENGGPKLDLEPIRLEGMEDVHVPAELCVARKETMLVRLKTDVCHIRVVLECVCNPKKLRISCHKYGRRST